LAAMAAIHANSDGRLSPVVVKGIGNGAGVSGVNRGYPAMCAKGCVVVMSKVRPCVALFRRVMNPA